MLDRQDESLETTGSGGEWKLALNPMYGVDRCSARPAPVNYTVVIEARQCPPGVCRAPDELELGGIMNWSDPQLWQASPFLPPVRTCPSSKVIGSFLVDTRSIAFTLGRCT